MYIIVISRGYPTSQAPLNGIFEFDQARALAKAGQKVIYAAVDLRSLRRWRKWGIEHFLKDGVEVYAINIPLGRLPHSILRCIGQCGLRILYRLIQKEHGVPDIIHAHFLSIAEIALTLKTRLKKTKFVMTEHWSLIASDASVFPHWVKRSARAIYASYDRVIAVSQFLAEEIHKKFHVDVICIPNMLDPLFLNKRQRNSHDMFEFIFVGNLNNNKSPLECIQAFYDAFHDNNFTTKQKQQICLRLIGGGPLFHECQELISELKLGNNVVMMGQMTRDKIAEILSASDCFVLPSKLETFGVVYIEAMACGLPIIATKCGGPDSFVNEDNGVLIPVDDEGALISAFREMAANIDRYNKKEIASMASDNFSPEVIANKLINIYTTLLKNCNNAGASNGR